MANRIAGDTHDLCLLPSKHIYQQVDSRLVISSFPLSQKEMSRLRLLPTLIYCLSARESPPHLPSISYCLVASFSTLIMPTEAISLFWSNASLLFGVPNRLVIHKDILHNYPSILDFCTDEGVLPEVDMRPPTSVMRKRLQWISFRLVERFLDSLVASGKRTLDIPQCNDMLLRTASSFQHRERFPLRAVLPISEKDSARLQDYVLATQNVFLPSTTPVRDKQETFPLLRERAEHKSTDDENLLIVNSRVIRDHPQQNALHDARSFVIDKQFHKV